MTKAEHVRLVAWRSKFLQHAAGETRGVAHTCRYFGISRKTYSKWKRRHASHGDAGLSDRARVPHRSPRATPVAVVSKNLVPAPALPLRRRSNRGLSPAVSIRRTGLGAGGGSARRSRSRATACRSM